MVIGKYLVCGQLGIDQKCLECGGRVMIDPGFISQAITEPDGRKRYSLLCDRSVIRDRYLVDAPHNFIVPKDGGGHS